MDEGHTGRKKELVDLVVDGAGYCQLLVLHEGLENVVDLHVHVDAVDAVGAQVLVGAGADVATELAEEAEQGADVATAVLLVLQDVEDVVVERSLGEPEVLLDLLGLEVDADLGGADEMRGSALDCNGCCVGLDYGHDPLLRTYSTQDERSCLNCRSWPTVCQAACDCIFSSSIVILV